MAIEFKTPYYNSLFIASAKRRSAVYKDGAWQFDDADRTVVDKLNQKYFGRNEAERVTLRVIWPNSDSVWQHAVEVAGRTVARAFGRDSGAKLGEDIVIVKGGFGSGGSMKNWTTTVDAGTEVLIRNFSKWYAEKLIAEDSERYSIFDDAGTDVDIEDL